MADGSARVQRLGAASGLVMQVAANRWRKCWHYAETEPPPVAAGPYLEPASAGRGESAFTARLDFVELLLPSLLQRNGCSEQAASPLA